MVEDVHTRPDPSRDEAERQRLVALVERLSDADLARPLDGGWTIAATLAHMAFYDRRAAVLFEKWRHRPPSAQDSPGDVDVLNEAALPQWRAIPPRAAANEAIAAAEAADRAVASADPRLLEQVLAAGPPISLVRAEHRAEHLDQIERALGQ